LPHRRITGDYIAGRNISSMKQQSKQPGRFDLRKQVRELIYELPSYEFDALMNQVAYLDYYLSIRLKKSYAHHLDHVIDKSIIHNKPHQLYDNAFTGEECVEKLEVYLFENSCLYRAKTIYQNEKYRLHIRIFKSRDDAENFLVERLSDFMTHSTKA
jgi:hypothetical protein